MVPQVTTIPDVKQALEYAIETASPKDVICVAGSLYVVGEAKEALDKGFQVQGSKVKDR
jgi:dihydrofolate synthase/folylpolyglutamate synthase